MSLLLLPPFRFVKLFAMSSSTIPPSRREEILAPRREQLLEWLPARDMSKAAARLWVLDFHDEVWVRGVLLRFVIL